MKKFMRILLPAVGGSLVGLLTTQDAKKDYQRFKKPPYAPPKEAFGIVWPVLYVTMGVAHDLVKKTRRGSETDGVYHLQLALNYLWSLLYFRFKMRGTALIESYLLLGAVICTTLEFYKKHKVAGLILLPYVVWSSYATYLNAGNWLLNRNKAAYYK